VFIYNQSVVLQNNVQITVFFPPHGGGASGMTPMNGPQKSVGQRQNQQHKQKAPMSTKIKKRT
jgi:hypothetical protein